MSYLTDGAAQDGGSPTKQKLKMYSYRLNLHSNIGRRSYKSWPEENGSSARCRAFEELGTNSRAGWDYPENTNEGYSQ